MPPREPKADRDIDRSYGRKQFIEKLRRLADALESGDRFRIQVAGERISIPPDAEIGVEHERGEGMEEVEFQLRWRTA